MKIMALILAFLVAKALGHGAMYEPPTRNSQGMSLLSPTCPGGACQYYNQGCEIGCPEISGTQEGCEKHSVEPSLVWGSHDHLLQYKQDGYGGDTTYNPWRYPGASPVKDSCGITGGFEPPEGQLDPPPGVEAGASGQTLPRLLDKTHWVAGSTVEVAFGIAANHGGGYQYRLCPASEALTEDCFKRTPLEFVGDEQWIQFGGGFDTSDRIAVKAQRVSGTLVVPLNSTWTMNPIPGCTGKAGRARTPCLGPTFPPPGAEKIWPYAQQKVPGIFGYGGGHCFGNLSKNPAAKCSLEEYKDVSFDFGIVDVLRVPSDLPEGDYVLSWRWDCEMTKQIWTSCSDVTIKGKGPGTRAFSPSKGCTACCTGICSNCSTCQDNKEGDCAYCWEPLPWWGGRDFWTPRAKAIQCLGFEGVDGGPGSYAPGDDLSTPWSPGCPKCWESDGCESYVRGVGAAVVRGSEWTLRTALLVALAAATASAGLFLCKRRSQSSQSGAQSPSASPSPARSMEMTPSFKA